MLFQLTPIAELPVPVDNQIKVVEEETEPNQTLDSKNEEESSVCLTKISDWSIGLSVEWANGDCGTIADTVVALQGEAQSRC